MPDPPAADSTPIWMEWGISVLNGIIGDYLHERGNGLAIAMAFYHQNRLLSLTPESLKQAHPNPSSKLCILLHGLGCHEGVWRFRAPAKQAQGVCYGTLLEQELGYTPFYVRYNTGLRIAQNGRSLARLLDELLASYPASVAEIRLIGHSMGGLVLRSACHYGVRHQHGWVEKVKQVFYLGTPHEGADLERFGCMATALLQAVPNPITRLIGDILDSRSQGIKDLGLGNLLDELPVEAERSAPEQAVPWLASARHYLILGTVTAQPQHPVAQLLGDALVRAPKGYQHTLDDAERRLGTNRWVKLFPQIHHLGLARHPEVYQQIKAWCSDESGGDD